MNRPPIHCVVYGTWGSGKSSFAATFPKPMLVLQRDPLGKEIPYLQRGLTLEGDPKTGPEGQLVYHVYSRREDHPQIVQVELFLENNVKRPQAHAAFERRFLRVCDETVAGLWATVVIDGVTELEFGARKKAEYHDLRGAKDPRKWYAASAHDVDEVIRQAACLPCNVVVIAHIDDEYDEVLGCRVHSPAAPGKVRSRFGSSYTEIYVAHAMRPKPGEPVRYWLQTRTDQRCAAASIFLKTPDPSPPDYDKLWTVYDAQKPATITAAELSDGVTAPAAAEGKTEDVDNGKKV